MALKTISVAKMSNSDVRLSVNFGILSNAKTGIIQHQLFREKKQDIEVAAIFGMSCGIYSVDWELCESISPE